jgi:hypothetical protein
MASDEEERKARNRKHQQDFRDREKKKKEDFRKRQAINSRNYRERTKLKQNMSSLNNNNNGTPGVPCTPLPVETPRLASRGEMMAMMTPRPHRQHALVHELRPHMTPQEVHQEYIHSLKWSIENRSESHRLDRQDVMTVGSDMTRQILAKLDSQEKDFHNGLKHLENEMTNAYGALYTLAQSDSGHVAILANSNADSNDDSAPARAAMLANDASTNEETVPKNNGPTNRGNEVTATQQQQPGRLKDPPPPASSSFSAGNSNATSTAPVPSTAFVAPNTTTIGQAAPSTFSGPISINTTTGQAPFAFSGTAWTAPAVQAPSFTATRGGDEDKKPPPVGGNDTAQSMTGPPSSPFSFCGPTTTSFPWAPAAPTGNTTGGPPSPFTFTGPTAAPDAPSFTFGRSAPPTTTAAPQGKKTAGGNHKRRRAVDDEFAGETVPTNPPISFGGTSAGFNSQASEGGNLFAEGTTAGGLFGGTSCASNCQSTGTNPTCLFGTPTVALNAVNPSNSFGFGTTTDASNGHGDRNPFANIKLVSNPKPTAFGSHPPVPEGAFTFGQQQTFNPNLAQTAPATQRYRTFKTRDGRILRVPESSGANENTRPNNTTPKRSKRRKPTDLDDEGRVLKKSRPG